MDHATPPVIDGVHQRKFVPLAVPPCSPIPRLTRGEELHRWRVKWQEYRRWLAENQDVAEALDSLRAEAAGEQLYACLPSHGDGPWTIQGVQ